MIQFADWRIVRLHKGFSVLEKKDGRDWMQVQRWRCASSDKDNFRTLTVDGETRSWVKREILQEILNELSDEMMRKKRGYKRKRN